MVLVLLPAEQKDHGFEVACMSPDDEGPGSSPEADAVPFQGDLEPLDQPDAVSSLPTPSDILVSYSTFPGECVCPAKGSPSAPEAAVLSSPGSVPWRMWDCKELTAPL